MCTTPATRLVTPEIVERQRKLDDRWFGELSLAALATARAARGDAQVRWMYRQEPANPRDSGWRVFAGDESDSEANDPENVVIVPLRDLTAAEADLESLFRTPAPCAFERRHDGGFTAVEYQPPQDLPGVTAVTLVRHCRAAAAFSASSSASSCAEPMCSIFRDPHREDHSIWTAVAPTRSSWCERAPPDETTSHGLVCVRKFRTHSQ